MAKYFQVAAILALVMALTHAEPAHFRGSRRFFARQEVAPAAATPDFAAAPPQPYPAAGVTPEVPFDLPTETEAPQPDLTYGPPDDTYGPPEVAPEPDNTYGPPAAEPDNTYGPPSPASPNDANTPAIDDPAAAAEQPQTGSGNDLVSQSLIQPRNSRLRSRVRPSAAFQRLRAAPGSRVEIVRAKPILVYTLE